VPRRKQIECQLKARQSYEQQSGLATYALGAAFWEVRPIKVKQPRQPELCSSALGYGLGLFDAWRRHPRDSIHSLRTFRWWNRFGYRRQPN